MSSPKPTGKTPAPTPDGSEAGSLSPRSPPIQEYFTENEDTLVINDELEDVITTSRKLISKVHNYRCHEIK